MVAATAVEEGECSDWSCVGTFAAEVAKHAYCPVCTPGVDISEGRKKNGREGRCLEPHQKLGKTRSGHGEERTRHLR